MRKLGNVKFATNRTTANLKLKGKAIKSRNTMRDLIDSANPKKHLLSWGDDSDSCMPADDEDAPVIIGTGDILINQPLKVDLKFPNTSVMAFHIGVWRLACPKATEALMLITRNNRADEHDLFEEEIILTFPTEEAKMASVEWWAEYQTRYDVFGETALPRFTPGKAATIHALSTKEDGNKYHPDEWDLFHTWVWLVKNTSGKIWWTSELWFFEDLSELSFFKLSSPIEPQSYKF
jgi:hypothetical protein